MSDRELARSGSLDDAAGALLTIGCCEPAGISTQIRVSCLWGSERLRVIGARPAYSLEAVEDDNVAAKLQAAVIALDGLVDETSRGIAVSEVAAVVRDILAAIS